MVKYGRLPCQCLNFEEHFVDVFAELDIEARPVTILIESLQVSLFYFISL